MGYGIYLVPNLSKIQTSEPIRESNSSFSAPAGNVIVGRKHTGDENGMTEYQYAPLIADPTQSTSLSVTLASVHWVDAGKESASDFNAPPGWVIVGREHEGDENGDTKYQIAQVLVGSAICKTVDVTTSNPIEESAGIWYVSPSMGTLMQAITGRKHQGDENKPTTYYSSLIFYQPPS